ncbi:MAG: hypothetical protein IID40_06075, partial [Planctomycetes bacterium]|nr:hypothetical protein [Planctomycetota bacterium]
DAQVTVEAVVPDDYEDGDLRGQTAKFELTVHDIKRLKLPEIDEAFLSALGAESEKELREMIKADAEANIKQMVQHQMRTDVRAYLLDKTELEIPEGLSQRQTDRAIARRMIELYRMGIPQPEIEKRIDQLKASAAEEAVSDLKYFFIMEKIADELEVEVSEEELNSAIAGIAQRRGGRFDRVRDELSKGGGIENLYVQIRDDKILDRLVGDAKVSDAPAERPKKKKK